MALDLTAFDAMLKEWYTSDEIYNMTYPDNPFHAMVPKMESFYGDALPLPIIYGNSQGRSGTFAKALANKTASKQTKFVLTRDHDYSLADVDVETLMASKNDAGSFLEAATHEIGMANQSLVRSLAIAEYGSGTGKIGQISGTPDTDITLSDPEDVTNFEVGQTLVASTANGGGAQKDPVKVTAVNREDGILTMAVDVASVESWADADYLFVEGDYDGKIKGLDAWVPATAPTSTAFFGVDRSVDTRLGGLRKNVSNMPIEEGLIECAKLGNRESGRIDYGFMTYDLYGDLEKSLGSKVQYIDNFPKAEIGFRGIQLNHNRGTMQIHADQNATANVCHMLTMNTWKLYSLESAPFIQEVDGNKWLRLSGEDSVEIRLAYYAQLGCRPTGFNVRALLKA